MPRPSPPSTAPLVRDLSRRSAAGAAHWIDDPAAFRTGMAIIHAAAASFIDAIVPAPTAGDLLQLAA